MDAGGHARAAAFFGVLLQNLWVTFSGASSITWDPTA